MVHQAIRTIAALAAVGGKIGQLVFLWKACAWLLGILGHRFGGLLQGVGFCFSAT